MSEENVNSAAEAALKSYRKGMRSLGRGLMVFAVLQLVIGGLSLVFGPEPFLAILLGAMGFVHAILGFLLLRNLWWANNLVALWSVLIFGAVIVRMGQQQRGSDPGSLVGLIIVVAMFCYAAQNLSALRKARGAGLYVDEDRGTKSRPLLALTPSLLGIVLVVAGCALFSFPGQIDPAEWQRVAPPGAGFQALMPGTPRVQQQAQETPLGKVQIDRYVVEPKNRKEAFVIIATRFPEDSADQLGGPENLLNAGRQDLLIASQGQLSNEKPIELGGCRGLEIEVLPSQGAIIKARIYATKNQLFQIAAHVPKIRATSEDVQKFLASFQVR